MGGCEASFQKANLGPQKDFSFMWTLVYDKQKVKIFEFLEHDNGKSNKALKRDLERITGVVYVTIRYITKLMNLFMEYSY